jgi:enamine deaminase RidA (YjgF/YER057c/UK114 family)
MARQTASTGNIWEKAIGFSRAVRVGNMVFTAGTIAADSSGEIHGGDCYEQCVYIIEKLRGVLRELDCELDSVVRVVCYLTDLADADGFTRAHCEFFGAIRPAATCIQVAGLFGKGARVELELTAVIEG